MDFNQQLQACVEQANDALRRFIDPLPFQNTPLVEAMQYGALLGGKRLRPFLVYATGRMFGVSQQTLDAPAAAVECIHAYSLMHDDLPAMDDDDLRRGLPTCHIKFGEANAILAGDALQTLAFSILTEAPMADVAAEDRLAMVATLANASGVAGMCGGQALDLAAENEQVSLEGLEQIHRHKTGALICAAVKMGALSAGQRGRDALPLLERYAQCVGLAFQVQDDILDVVGDTATLGKRQGADQQLGKSTYPALLGLEQARTKARDLIDDARQALSLLSAQSLDTTALEALANYIIQRDK
ncbi:MULTISPECIES: (2E,6E)-farnesyl diphosphate synthase [Kosakonia]|jgi:farnesyl diphosphate synthase|uniref:(2E,6E)-farnesyl diphosphate synthase n=1 Tax=Kosakonia cowanii JCM 10956 = DSM 18146 TaxID=1300165 RepID=A0A807LG05_9ENTR|nr:MULTISPECIES: (2E,6E)-farnesyl diphosphate synthase [Kosakonia]MDP9771021.1 farnesyl diphosphate synthase [Atlantibacter hermannii]APZ05536.1 (2E,6E)-farnesyl diphosphate synthase [Kosakonia cowanii JCM 10956 = DSM 18146]AST68197.1 (2E,6E)-farnesyl diphosphate synthase [Kosakonia cowanii]MDF2622703.1 (2E,6E)-farnesyl diphosphate synthase [Kosakonia cowanii]MDF7758635.1 (2E,6E)-farnesyl diphosphate synthase [Kosakonia cowanii]